MIETHEHTIHSDPVKWFKRAEGYLWHVIGMIGGGGGCLGITRQTAAAEGAVRAAKRLLVHDCIDYCLSNDDGSVLAEMKALTKLLSGHPMLSVLMNRTYRHLFTAQVIALVGTNLMRGGGRLA